MTRAGWRCLGCGWNGSRDDATPVHNNLTCPDCGTALTTGMETSVDDEIKAIEACVTALEPTTQHAQDRILDYLCARFGRRIAVADV